MNNKGVLQMNVSQVIEIAKEWVEENVSQVPGFCGAYLGGSLSRMPKDASFPTYRDVDTYIIAEDVNQIPITHPILRYKGVLLERFRMSLGSHSSAEAVFSNPLVTSNLATGVVISDPAGLLGKLQQTIRKEYARRKWVQVRLEAERKRALENLEKMSHANTPIDMFDRLSWIVYSLAGVIAIAHLRPPTVRRCLALTRELLHSQGKTELHEEILKVYGCAHMSQKQVEFYLHESTNAYDTAVEVKHTPPTNWLANIFIHPDVRPYLVNGAQEIIDDGSYRETMFWIAFFHSLANTVIQNDAPDEEKPKYQAGFDGLLNGLGLSTRSDWQSRSQLADSVVKEVFQLADEVVESHPDII
jgi:hypothetical protein